MNGNRSARSASALALLLVVAGYAGCGRERNEVTGPRLAVGVSAEATAVPRMAIIRVQRGTPTRIPTPTARPAGVPSATPTQPSNPTPTPPGPTATAPPTSVPTSTATRSPSPTRTPSGTIIVSLRAVNWAWQFVSGTDAYGKPADGTSFFTLKQGQRYELHVYNGGIPDPAYAIHIFSGNSGLGVSGATVNFGPDIVQTFTAPAPGTYAFLCNESGCGRGHDTMTGAFTVVP